MMMSILTVILSEGHLGSTHCPIATMGYLKTPSSFELSGLVNLLSTLNYNMMYSEFSFLNPFHLSYRAHELVHDKLVYHESLLHTDVVALPGIETGVGYLKFNSFYYSEFDLYHKLDKDIRYGLMGHPVFVVNREDGFVDVCIITHRPPRNMSMSLLDIQAENGPRYISNFVYRLPIYLITWDEDRTLRLNIAKDKEELFNFLKMHHAKVEEVNITPLKMLIGESVIGVPVVEVPSVEIPIPDFLNKTTERKEYMYDLMKNKPLNKEQINLIWKKE